MADIFQIDAVVRTEKGTSASRRLRHAGKVPAVIYGAGKDPQWVSIGHKEISHALAREAFYSHILTMNIDGKSEQVVLKDLLRHPFKKLILHADFLRINPNEKLSMHVPIHYIGEAESPGVSEGGVVSKLKNDVEIRCLPKDLPEYIEIDVSKLELDQTYHLSDLKLPKGVELAGIHLDDEHNLPIISIHLPRAAKEETPEAEAEVEIEAAADSESTEENSSAE